MHTDPYRGRVPRPATSPAGDAAAGRVPCLHGCHRRPQDRDLAHIHA